MISFPIVDPHLHFWDLSLLRYPWLDGYPLINRTFLLNDFDQARGPYCVEKMVFVQCECLPEQHLDELRWVNGLANGDTRIMGIVPWAPLEFGEQVRNELEAFATNPRVKGVRRIIQFDSDIDFCIRPNFVTGVRLLGSLGLHFELTIAPIHLPNVLKLVDKCPETQFVLDHIGNPEISRGELEPWATGIRQLSEYENVWCKVSGLATNAGLESWLPADFSPYLNVIFASFGFGRTMYAGDWPHALRATSYPRWIETLDEATRGCTDAERQRLFHDNAEEFYRI